MLLKAIYYAAAVFGGLALAGAPLTPSGRAAPRWIRVALWISGPAGLVWGILGYTLLFGSASLSSDSYDLLRHFKTLSAGIAVGILVLLLGSREFRASFTTKTKGQ